MVTGATTRALCTVFAPTELSAARIDAVLTATAQRFRDATGAREASRAVI
jgi:hypothetical protein